MNLVKINKQTKEKMVTKVLKLHTAFTTSLILVTPAFAVNSNTGAMDIIVTFLCDWGAKVGSVLGLIGGFTFAVGWYNDQQEMKSKGLMGIVGGLMMFAIAKSPDIFGL